MFGNWKRQASVKPRSLLIHRCYWIPRVAVPLAGTSVFGIRCHSRYIVFDLEVVASATSV